MSSAMTNLQAARAEFQQRSRELAPLETFTLDPYNARTHDEVNIQAIAQSLQRFKQQIPIVVDKDRIIRKGNGTWIAAKRLGWSDIWFVETELEAMEAAAFELADNRTAELSDWDYTALKATLEKFQASDVDISNLGWSDYDVKAILLQAEQPMPTAESLNEEFGDVAEDELWPMIKVRVPQELFLRFDAIMKGIQIDGDHNRFEKILDVYEIASQ
jgi:ParB/Sulfiredoxin domain